MTTTLMEIPQELAEYTRTLRLPDGLHIHCYEAGGGAQPPLILVHGLGDEADTWRAVLPALAEQRRVIALDLPGFGRSSGFAHGSTLTNYARTLLALLDEMGIGAADFVGSSYGAMLIQRLALARPQRMLSATLIDGALPIVPTKLAPPMLTFLTPGLGERAYTQLRISQKAAYDTLRPYYFDLDSLPEEQKAFLRRRVWARVWSDTQCKAFLSTLRWLVIDGATRAADWRQRLAACRVPTQLLWGDTDRISSPELGETMAKTLPNATFTVIPNCGHLPHQERPEIVVEAILGG